MNNLLKNNTQTKQLIIWIGALVIGAFLGTLGIEWINSLADFTATVFTRLFQFLAVPTIALAVVTTLATLGTRDNTGRIFRRTLTYTLLTTIAAAAVGLVLYIVIAPGNLPASITHEGGNVSPDLTSLSYYDHIVNAVPNNLVKPFIEGNVLSVLLIAAALGIGISRMEPSNHKETLLKAILGLQELFFILIKWLIIILPVGIIAFSAQLTAFIESGVILGSLGKYVLVILGGNAIQFFIVLPLFLIIRGLNPLKVFRAMYPALLMALFTKSSAATLPVTMQSAENRLGAKSNIARFVLPICTTINMNGCAAFILVTSLFVMQNAGGDITPSTMLTWLFIAVFSAIGNAGVPMGCYFLTLSLVSGVTPISPDCVAPLAIMGIILPIFTVIDMIETAENVWSDSCVCAMTDSDFK